MSLLQTWNGLSDCEIENRVNDSISFGYFCAIPMDSVAPDQSTLSHFRIKMAQAKAFQALFHQINAQLEAHRVIVKTGVIVDASVIETPLNPKGKTNYKVTEDRAEEEKASFILDIKTSCYG